MISSAQRIFLLVLFRIGGKPHGVVGRPSIAHQLFHAQIHRRRVVLVDDGNFFGKVFQPHSGNIAVPQEDFPFVRTEVFRHQVEQGTLSTAVGSDEGGDFPLVKLQVQILQHLLFAVGKGEVFDGKYITGHSFVSTSSSSRIKNGPPTTDMMMAALIS